MFAEVATSCLSVLKGEMVFAEIDLGRGIPDFQIVGLGDTSVHESRKRIRSAIANSGMGFPLGRLTVNLAPANVKKEGVGFDLAVAVGILMCQGVIKEHCADGTVILGELSLDGKVRGINGILPMMEECKRRNYNKFIIPASNVKEASLVSECDIIGVESLTAAVNYLRCGTSEGVNIIRKGSVKDGEMYVECAFEDNKEDMSDIFGQKKAKRVAEIAAAGGHNILIKGSPGCGKTMLARRMAGILPPMTLKEALEVTAIYSGAGLLKEGSGLVTERPFRQITGGITPGALVGGGTKFSPGEISLAHNGILFIDEFSSLSGQAGEMLRKPLEDKYVSYTRQGKTVEIPADFLLICVSNPCPCGMLYEEGKCRCTPNQIRNYGRKTAGPLADRIDIHLDMVSVPYNEINDGDNENSETIRKRVRKVREIHRERYKKEGMTKNSDLSGKMLEKYCETDRSVRRFLNMVMDKSGFSLRGYEKVLKISRTLADMAEREIITEEDVAEAVQYRPVAGVGDPE